MKHQSVKLYSALPALFLASTTAFALPTITGSNSSAAADFIQYKAVGSNLSVDSSASLPSIIAGNAAAPGGNVELFASSETLTNAAFAGYNGTTSLNVDIGGATLTLSSLNYSDWTANSNQLLNQWTNDLFTTYLSAVNTPTNQAAFQALFLGNGGLQRFSDPNISYAYTDGTTVNIGLAGLYNASALLNPLLTPLLTGLGLPTSLLPSSVQLSELVKVTYDGATNYLYSFSATQSGVSTADGSYSGNYNISFADTTSSVQIPEPSTLMLISLSLTLIGFAKKRKI